MFGKIKKKKKRLEVVEELVTKIYNDHYSHRLRLSDFSGLNLERINDALKAESYRKSIHAELDGLKHPYGKMNVLKYKNVDMYTYTFIYMGKGNYIDDINESTDNISIVEYNFDKGGFILTLRDDKLNTYTYLIDRGENMYAKRLHVKLDTEGMKWTMIDKSKFN